jgi:hypothetical protein
VGAAPAAGPACAISRGFHAGETADGSVAGVSPDRNGFTVSQQIHAKQQLRKHC